MTEIQKCTLVPTRFFDGKAPKSVLSDLFPIGDDEVVNYVELPRFEAVLLYAGQELPLLYRLLESLDSCTEYNKILVSWENAAVHIVIAQGPRLLLANTYPAEDFTTAEYFIFFAMKSLQLNPEISCITFASELTGEQEMSLYRYFKSVERL